MSSPPQMRDRCVSRGLAVPSELLGAMPDSAPLRDDPPALRRRLAEDGFLFLAGVLPRELVLSAREAVLRRLAAVGEVAMPIGAGRFTGTSRRRELAADLGQFWQSVSEEPRLRSLTHGPALRAAVETVLGEPSVAHDMLFLRAGVPGRATDLHYDCSFFARTTERTLTAWVPLGDVPVEQGPLMVVAGSNRFEDLIDGARHPESGTAGRRAALEGDAASVARSRRARLLTRDFRAGDLVLLGMFICHGSLDHHAADNAIRLSFDLRFQPAAAPRDPRFFGPRPPGLTGRGYGELNGAKPLTEDWHQR